MTVNRTLCRGRSRLLARKRRRGPRHWPVLGEAEVFWLFTVRPDGRPHATPLLAAWSLGGVCFTTGGQERKARNLEHNPRCVLTTGTNALTGVDVVIEGVASVVGERSEREQAVADFERKYGTHLTAPGVACCSAKRERM